MSAEPTSMTITRVLSPTEWATKQLSTLEAVGRSHYVLGISRPKRSPIAAGSSDASEAAYRAQVMIALDKKSRQRGVAASSDDIWFRMSKGLGAENLVKGVVQRKEKVVKFLNAWQPTLKAHLDTIDPLGTATLEERMTKMVANARGLAALHGATKGV